MVLNENIIIIIKDYIPNKNCKLCRKKINKLLVDSYCSNKCFLRSNINDRQIISFLFAITYLFSLIIISFIKNVIFSFDFKNFLDNILHSLLSFIFFLKFILQYI